MLGLKGKKGRTSIFTCTLLRIGESLFPFSLIRISLSFPNQSVEIIIALLQPKNLSAFLTGSLSMLKGFKIGDLTNLSFSFQDFV